MKFARLKVAPGPIAFCHVDADTLQYVRIPDFFAMRGEQAKFLWGVDLVNPGEDEHACDHASSALHCASYDGRSAAAAVN